MGLIKFKGVTIFQGNLAKVDVASNWCDSMATYYPYLIVWNVDPMGIISSQPLHVDGFYDPHTWERDSEIELDLNQSLEMSIIQKKVVAQREAKKIRMHSVVKVVKGRKVPIGTEGDIFWMGDSGYGMSVGIRKLNGDKVFTAIKNVEVLDVEAEVEKILLGEGT